MDEALCLVAVALFLDEVKIFGMEAKVEKAFIEGVENDVIRTDAAGNRGGGGVEGDGLRDGGEGTGGKTAGHQRRVRGR